MNNTEQNIKKEFITDVIHSMQPYITQEQLEMLETTLHLKLNNITLTTTEKALSTVLQDDETLIQRFMVQKAVEGLSPKTIIQYRDAIYDLLRTVKKPILSIVSDDIKYLIAVKMQKGLSKITIDNTRRFLNAFFGYLAEEDILTKNPMVKVKRIKCGRTVKKAFTASEMEQLRGACNGNLRDRALIEVLLSTACRVSEIVGLNRKDIDFDTGEATVIGKGSKERKVYFSEISLLHLKKYLDSRADNAEALFVTIAQPHKRISSGGIETRIREIGRSVGVEAYPHKFRRTGATMAAKRGMPIEQVQKLLGHERIDTTMIYAVVDQTEVKNSHRKYLG